MPETRKMISRDDGVLGQDEPEILEGALAGQKQTGPYRHTGTGKVKRGTGVVARVRKAARPSKSLGEKRDK